MARNTLFSEQRFLFNPNFEEIQRTANSFWVPGANRGGATIITAMCGTTVNTPLTAPRTLVAETFKTKLSSHSASAEGSGEQANVVVIGRRQYRDFANLSMVSRLARVAS